MNKKYSDNCNYLVEALNAGVFGFVWGKLYKREIIINNTVEMNTKGANYEDEDFNLQYLIHCKQIQTIAACDYVYSEPTNGKSYRKTDYISQAITFLSLVKQMKNYHMYKDYLNTWIADRFLLGICSKSSTTAQMQSKNLAIFQSEFLPYLSKCPIIKNNNRKRAIILHKLLAGRPSLLRIHIVFYIVKRL